ncbi:glycoside hydrolase [Stachybotrys elegans]|uniref:Mannan endo-1,6-alpha-mannosidase n=1 Tax=Stachybotrys elegans TaxID=80388 RepID=A0A8K0WSR6_9HYPO|nr:glycoside hydrolase [Stachybotrys elegans]
MKWPSSATLVALGLLNNMASAIPLDVEDEDSVKDAAATVAFDMMSYYTGNRTGDTPGFLPDPYYWWLAGAMFGTMVDYRQLTGDRSYDDPVRQALMHQMGETNDYNHQNVTSQMGNDDQGFWAMSAMLAAETLFPDPPEDHTQYVPAVQAVFNEYVMRWEDEGDLCDGGLRWQVYSTGEGWDYKNTISNGCFFNVAARLGRYTANDTYLEWAERVWDWVEGRDLINENYEIRDGTHIDFDTMTCPGMDRNQWSYNAGIFLHGAAVMYNSTGESIWRERVEGILDNIEEEFFRDGIAFEPICEPLCNRDQLSFKGYLLRWMAWTTQLVPGTYDRIHPVLIRQAEAAAATCIGTADRGIPGTACGFSWTNSSDTRGGYGVAQQMNVLAAIITTLIGNVDPPASLENGGTSIDDPSGGRRDESPYQPPPITTADRVGAGFVTAIYCCVAIGFFTSLSMMK